MTDAAASPTPRWRRLGADERRAEILDAAIVVFGEQPYDGVQVGEIAKRAGVARALIHHYYGTKRELYLEVVRAMMIVPPLDDVRLPDGSVRQRIEGFVDWLLKALGPYARTWVAVGAGGVVGDAELQAILDDADDLAARRVLEAVGFVGSGREEAVALATVRAYGGMVKAALREWVDRGDLSVNQVREILVETLVVLVDRVLVGQQVR